MVRKSPNRRPRARTLALSLSAPVSLCTTPTRAHTHTRTRTFICAVCAVKVQNARSVPHNDPRSVSPLALFLSLCLPVRDLPARPPSLLACPASIFPRLPPNRRDNVPPLRLRGAQSIRLIIRTVSGVVNFPGLFPNFSTSPGGRFIMATAAGGITGFIREVAVYNPRKVAETFPKEPGINVVLI